MNFGIVKSVVGTKPGLIVLAATMSALLSSIPHVHADEASATQLLKSMSDYLASQKTISFDFDSNLEIVTRENQKLGLASSGTVALNRPDKLRATRKGGFANVEVAFDGKTLTLIGKNLNMYTQVESPGTIDTLVDVLRDKYNRPVPAADLLVSDPYKQLMPEVVDVKDLGSGVIRGVECDHLAFRTPDVDWQIWIAQGEHPYPCRYVVTSTKVLGEPQYTVDVTGWKAGAEVETVGFGGTIPADAQKLNAGDVTDLKDFDELPTMFTIKGGN